MRTNTSLAIEPSAVAVWLTLLCSLLLCTHSGHVCVSGFSEVTLASRYDRHLQATTPPQQKGQIMPPADSTIYGSSLGAGWMVEPYGSKTADPAVLSFNGSQSQAFCATLDAELEEFHFYCQNCSQTSYKPFELNKASELQMMVRHTNSEYRAMESHPWQTTLPDIGVVLYDESEEISCSFNLEHYAQTPASIGSNGPDNRWSAAELTNSTRNNSTGWFSRSYIFHNFQPCIPSLASVTRIGFYSPSNSSVSFCLRDLSLLPSQVPSIEMLANAIAPSYPRVPNCKWRSPVQDALLLPQPTDKGGNFLVFQDKAIVHNVSGTPPTSGYTVFPGAELPGYAMAPARLTNSSSQADNLICSTNSSAPHLVQVNACATSASGPDCCIDTALYMSDVDSAQLPEELAKICNGLTINGLVCQGFTYNFGLNTAYFKGQSPSLPLSLQDSACNGPNVSFWALNAALSLTDSDERAIAVVTPVSNSPRVIYSQKLEPGWIVEYSSNNAYGIDWQGTGPRPADGVAQPLCATLPAQDTRRLLRLHLQTTLTYPTRNDVIIETGSFLRSCVFHNFQPCIPSLPAATRIRFSSLSNSGVRFCLQGLSLLPSQVASAEVLANAIAPSYPMVTNCKWERPVQRALLFPQPTDQDGNFQVFQDKAVVHNVSGTLASSDYTVFPGIDLPGYAMTPVRLTNTSNQDEHPSCSTHSSALRLAQVDACAASMASGPDCYIDTALYMSEFDSAQLPEELAKICDGLTINGVVCQGFTYNFGLNMAYFKGQPPSVPLNLKDSACNGPNVSFWALSSALSFTGADERAIAALSPAPSPAPPPPLPNPSGNNFGAIWGVVAAVVGPSIAIATWFFFTWNYRYDKKTIVDEVVRRFMVSNMCRVDSAPDNFLLGSVVRSGEPDMPSQKARSLARRITQRCLRRWDGWLGIRPFSDSLGNRAGIWRDRYDTVRCALLMLAFQNLHQALQADPASFRSGCPDGLLTAWQTSRSRRERQDVISWISKKVHEITEVEAQALPDRDPEQPSWYDKMCNILP